MRTFQFLLFGMLIPMLSFSQDQQNFEHLIDSKAFGKERKIKVFVPERYYRDTTTTFIVSYMLDSHDDQVWNMAKSNLDYMVSRYTVIPMIMVGVISEDRGSEFNPNNHELVQHLRDEVFPIVKENYRVDDFKTIIGHSWGGAFVGNTLFGENADMFNAYIGVSPSFDALDNDIYKAADSLLSAGVKLNKYLYYSSGEVGFELGYKHNVERMDSMMNAFPNSGIVHRSKLYDGMDHFSAVIPAINDGLTWMSRNYFADQMLIESFLLNEDQSLAEQMEAFYKHTNQQFGYSFKPSSGYYKYVADDLRDKENYESAITIYEWAIARDEENFKAYFNLADTYHKMKKPELAKPNFIKALDLMEIHKESVSQRYYNDLSEWAKGIIASYD